ncbi:MAG: hypothetical protein ACE5EQ_11395, partial [Phycisphaerae bacterium]
RVKSFCVAQPTPKLRWTEPLRVGWRFSSGGSWAWWPRRDEPGGKTTVFDVGELVSVGGWVDCDEGSAS